MKVLITKSDGTPTKSKVYAVKFLQDKGISEDCLIQENGQFFYEDSEVGAVQVPKSEAYTEPTDIEFEHSKPLMSQTEWKPVTWETPVYDKNNEKTKLHILGTDIYATINGKHPAGQLKNRNSFEINIGQENFIMSLDLISKMFVYMEG